MTNYGRGGGRAISALLTYYYKNPKFSDDDVAKIEYTYKSIKNDLLKIGLLYVVVLSFHQGMYLTCVLIPMIIIRMLIGGMHRPTFWGCFLMTSGWVFGGMIMGTILINNAFYFAACIMIVSILGVMKYGIAPSPKKNVLPMEKKKSRKHIAVVIEWIFVAVLLLLSKGVVAKGAFVGVTVTNLQVIIKRRFQNEHY